MYSLYFYILSSFCAGCCHWKFDAVFSFCKIIVMTSRKTDVLYTVYSDYFKNFFAQNTTYLSIFTYSFIGLPYVKYNNHTMTFTRSRVK